MRARAAPIDDCSHAPFSSLALVITGASSEPLVISQERLGSDLEDALSLSLTASQSVSVSVSQSVSVSVFACAVPFEGRAAVRRRQPAHAAREGEARCVPHPVVRAARRVLAAARHDRSGRLQAAHRTPATATAALYFTATLTLHSPPPPYPALERSRALHAIH